MEHRAHPRLSARVEAMVENRWLGQINARIRDVSANGLFLELPPRANLKPIAGSLASTPVTVRYRLPNGPAGRPCVWRGFVTRIGDSGVGASITNARTSGDPNLVRLVDYAQRTEARRRDFEASPFQSKSH